MDRQESTLPSSRWGRSTATSSLDSISGIMLDPVSLSGVFDQNDDVNDDNGGFCLILSWTMLDLVL